MVARLPTAGVMIIQRSRGAALYNDTCIFITIIIDFWLTGGNRHVGMKKKTAFRIESEIAYTLHSKNTRVSRDPEKGPNSIPGQRSPGNQSN